MSLRQSTVPSLGSSQAALSPGGKPCRPVSKAMVIFCGVLLLGTLYIPRRLAIDADETYCSIFIASDPSSRNAAPKAWISKFYKETGESTERVMAWQVLGKGYSPGYRAMLIGCWIIATLAIAGGITMRGLPLGSVCLGLGLSAVALRVLTVRYDITHSQVMWGGSVLSLAQTIGAGLATAGALATCAIWRRIPGARWIAPLLAISGLLLIALACVAFYQNGYKWLRLSPPTMDSWGFGRDRAVEYQLIVEAIPRAMRTYVWLEIASGVLFVIGGLLMLLHAAVAELRDWRLPLAGRVTIFSAFVCIVAKSLLPDWILQGRLHPHTPHQVAWYMIYCAQVLLLAEGVAGMVSAIVNRPDRRRGFAVSIVA